MATSAAKTVDKQRLRSAGPGKKETEPDSCGSRQGARRSAPASIYAIAEMSKRAEEYTLKVRSELYRIGCATGQLQVLRQGTYLQLKYQQQIILVIPQEILGVLKKIPTGSDVAEVWECICSHACQSERQKQLSLAGVAGLLSLVALLIILLMFLNR